MRRPPSPPLSFPLGAGPPPFAPYGPPQPATLRELRLAGALSSLNRADYLSHHSQTLAYATAPLSPRSK